MRLKELFTDDDSAVSPVIGVILMVAITVILAAVIATFVLGLGEQVSDATPNANFQAESPDNSFELNATEDNSDDGVIAEFTHTSGPALEADNLRIGSLSEQDIQDSVNEALEDSISGYDEDTAYVEVETTTLGLDDDDEISASDSVGLELTLSFEGDLGNEGGDTVQEVILEDEDVTMVWDSGSDSAVLRTFTIDEITLQIEETTSA